MGAHRIGEASSAAVVSVWRARAVVWIGRSAAVMVAVGAVIMIIGLVVDSTAGDPRWGIVGLEVTLLGGGAWLLCSAFRPRLAAVRLRSLAPASLKRAARILWGLCLVVGTAPGLLDPTTPRGQVGEGWLRLYQVLMLLGSAAAIVGWWGSRSRPHGRGGEQPVVPRHEPAVEPGPAGPRFRGVLLSGSERGEQDEVGRRHRRG